MNLNKWTQGNEAKKWPEGAVVLIRRNSVAGNRYDLRGWFRPDWVGTSEYEGKNGCEYMLLEVKN